MKFKVAIKALILLSKVMKPYYNQATVKVSPWLVDQNEREKLQQIRLYQICLLYTSDAADDMQCVDLGGRRIIKKK